MTYSIVSKTSEARKWLDDLCRDAKNKLGLDDGDLLWLLMDYTAHLHLKTMLPSHKQKDKITPPD